MKCPRETQHQRYMGHKITVRPNAKKLSALFLKREKMSWGSFSSKNNVYQAPRLNSNFWDRGKIVQQGEKPSNLCVDKLNSNQNITNCTLTYFNTSSRYNILNWVSLLEIWWECWKN
ncbi:unnamed protein product [Lactuca virosa]|uniref:Uncharacterized protein n=1 Tax=Lactuca virosa TaxID=75947 RepID=A0AAU9NRV4_9ASTR|nr:unnamed protein product [Lactuca virosa]